MSLNPYYTGIHLHFIKKELLKTKQLVLILIILEYIYMKKMKKGTVQFIVLILIILEYIYIKNIVKDFMVGGTLS